MKELKITYLSPQTQVSTVLTVRDRELKVYGRPNICSRVGPSAFYTSPEEDVFQDMPIDADIVVSHTPPYGILDTKTDRQGTEIHAGCKSLLAALEKTRPRLAVFGHIHESRKRQDHSWPKMGGSTVMINAAQYEGETTGFQHSL